MTRFADADLQLLAQVDVILTDVDDTLTRGGKLSALTLDAIERLSCSGLRVIPVTGGCAGWCAHLVRAWPVAAVIGESGDRERTRRHSIPACTARVPSFPDN